MKVDFGTSHFGKRIKHSIQGLLGATSIGFLAIIAPAVNAASVGDSPPVVPLPVEARWVEGKPFRLMPSTVIVCGIGTQESLARTVEALRRVTDLTLKTTPSSRVRGNIVLQLDRGLFPELPDWQRAESYQLAVKASGIELTAPSPHGLFNGMQTLAQLVAPDGPNRWHCAAASVTSRISNGMRRSGLSLP